MAVHTQHRGGALIGTLCLVLSAATAQAENAQAENAQAQTTQAQTADVPSSLAALGEALFHDTDLSANRSQACASCHDPALAFTDPRETEVGRAVSLGDNGQALGDRNAPSVTYAAAVPRFGHDAEGHPVGGLFWDGRAASLVEQAGGPPLNPLEMGLADAAALQARLQEKPAYVSAFGTFIGPQALATPEAALASFGQAIQAFEATPAVSSFDSKYDRWLAGSYQMTPQEELGRVLFFSQQFTNCNQCHQLRADPLARDETFSNYRFHNIGVPANAAVRAANGVTARDLGLAQAVAGDPGLRGQFRVPSLRNVAVTGPYMHNGAFADLRTVVLFYDKYNAKAAKRQINPETGQPWGAPEVEGTLSLTELEHGPALDDKRIDAIVAFLRTLTDARYEALLPE